MHFTSTAKEIGMLMQCMHDMARHEKMQLSQIKRNRVPTINYMVHVIFLTIKLNVISMLKPSKGELLKIKWNEVII